MNGAKNDRRKVHKPNSEWGKWERTECGRRITDRILTTDEGIEAVTCQTCKDMHDFGVIRR